MAVIACVDLDPVMTGLVERVRPMDTVLAVESSELLAGSRRYAAVIMSSGSQAAEQIRALPLATRTVLVVDQYDRGGVGEHPGPVVRRPVETTELRLALARLVPRGRWAQLRGRAQRLSGSGNVDAILAAARLGAVAAASGLELAGATEVVPTWLVALAVGWAVLRMWVRATSVGLVAVDLLVAVVAIMLTGGTDSSFLLLAAVVAAEVGYAVPPPLALPLVVTGTVAGLVPLTIQISRGTTDVPSLLAWATLIPMASAVGYLADRMRRSRSTGSLQLLTELHRTLDRLARQAQGFEGTLELSSLAEQVLTSLERDLETRAAVLLVGDGPIKTVAAATGLSDVAPQRLLFPEGSGSKLPAEVTALLPAGEAICTRIRTQGVDRGAIVVVVPGGTATRDAQRVLRDLAEIAAVAIDNARLFQGIRELTVDVERRRLARDLHDGVVQSLVHVGFELDLVSRELDGTASREIARLREVVGHTVDEVRATVNDLRSIRLSSGLGPALVSLARDYRREGLAVTADVDPVDGLAPESELHLLRIAQEALSNAVNHGRPSSVAVRLWQDDTVLHLQVIDDGVGLGNGGADNIDIVRGVGLRAMQERVDLLDARLGLGPGPDGGTCVQVDLPLERASS